MIGTVARANNGHSRAASALRQFLQPIFEEEQLTIYLADCIPGARERRARNPENKKDAKLEHKPLLVTDSDMNPWLIEGPIVINECARCARKTEREGQLESPAVLTRRSSQPCASKARAISVTWRRSEPQQPPKMFSHGILSARPRYC